MHNQTDDVYWLIYGDKIMGLIELLDKVKLPQYKLYFTQLISFHQHIFYWNIVYSFLSDWPLKL